MPKQIFEVLPKDTDIGGYFNILRYENAAQRSEIENLQSEVQRLMDIVETLEIKLDRQQDIIDLFNAELAQKRSSAK
ncbi:MAG: hypothetical protein AAGB11_08425 [Pseudomonadota bacterium]